jgi:hypothetical protein
MIFICWLAVAVLIGMYAQKGRGRTGAAWAFLAAIFYLLAWLMTDAAAMSDPHLAHDPNTEKAVDLLSAILVAIVMFPIVWTLPDKRRHQDSRPA